MSCYYLRYLKNVLCREPFFVIRYYLHKKNADIQNVPLYVFMADGKMAHGGLFDRLKGLVSIYAIAKIKSKRFAIYFKDPFSLDRFLEPNQYDWRAKDNEIIYSYPHTRPIVAYSEFKNPWRLFKSYHGLFVFF